MWVSSGQGGWKKGLGSVSISSLIIHGDGVAPKPGPAWLPEKVMDTGAGQWRREGSTLALVAILASAVAVTDTMTKNSLGEKAAYLTYFPHRSISEGSQGRKRGKCCSPPQSLPCFQAHA